MGKTAAVILAAGKGTRMRSPHAKAVHRVAQRPMICWVSQACQDADIQKIVAVVGHRKDEIKEVLGSQAIYAEQTELLGTGHAVMQAMPFLEDTDTVLILSGDVPLIRTETIREALLFHQEGGYGITVMAAVLENPTGYGRIVRDQDGSLKRITEEKDADVKTKQIREVNGGMYCFQKQALLEALDAIRPNNAQGEYYLTDAVEIIRSNGYKAGVFCLADAEEQNGVNDMQQLYAADIVMRKRIAKKHMAAGVYIWDMDHTYIGPEVSIAPGAEILPGCILSGKTCIGEDAVIGPSTTLLNCVVERGAQIENSNAKDSVIGENAKVGPFAYIRPGSKI